MVSFLSGIGSETQFLFHHKRTENGDLVVTSISVMRGQKIALQKLKQNKIMNSAALISDNRSIFKQIE